MYYVIRKTHLFLVVFVFFFNTTHSQSINTAVFASSGNEFFTTEASLQWTLGENFTETFKYVNGIQTLGFHQTFLRFDPIQLENDLKVFPNPFTSNINLHSGNEMDELLVKIFSITGTLVHEERIFMTGRYSLNLTFLKEGIYLLKISPGTSQNFVIIKLSK